MKYLFGIICALTLCATCEAQYRFRYAYPYYGRPYLPLYTPQYVYPQYGYYQYPYYTPNALYWRWQTRQLVQPQMPQVPRVNKPRPNVPFMPYAKD